MSDSRVVDGLESFHLRRRRGRGGESVAESSVPLGERAGREKRWEGELEVSSNEGRRKHKQRRIRTRWSTYSSVYEIPDVANVERLFFEVCKIEREGRKRERKGLGGELERVDGLMLTHL